MFNVLQFSSLSILFGLILFGSSEIMDNLVKEGVLSKIGKDTYAIIKDKVDIFF
jgi:hypothetical protein